MNNILKFLWLPILFIIAFVLVPPTIIKLISLIVGGITAIIVVGSVGWIIVEEIKERWL